MLGLRRRDRAVLRGVSDRAAHPGPVPLPSLQTGWRVLVPLVAGGAVALLVAGVLTAGADDGPTPRTASRLLADLQHVDVPGYAGTVVQKSTLLNSAPAGAGGLSLSRLMSGTNTIKVWYAGPQRQRIAVLDATGESDLYQNGDTVWQWDSNKRVAIQSVGTSSEDGVRDVPVPVDGTTVTPDDLARQAVAAITPDTSVHVAAWSTVAGRPAYQLVLTPPTSSATRIGRIVLWLDGDTRMPLAAQVYARNDPDEPSIDLTFTQIAFQVPDEEAFQFVPPDGATITAPDSTGAGGGSSPDPLLGFRKTRTTGAGWTRVAVIAPPSEGDDDPSLTTAQFGSRLTKVSGSWGHGLLLTTNQGLLSMLFVSDGSIVVGAVDPPTLYAALS